MEGRGAFIRVGLLILGGAAVLIGAVIVLAGGKLRGGTPFETYFRESVQGLEVGASVKYLGVTLGQVTDIGLTSAVYGRDVSLDANGAGYREVYVRFVIDAKRVGRVPDTKTAIENGLRAKLASQGLTGLSYIELAFINPADYPPQPVPWQPKDEYIPSMPSTLAQVSEAGQLFLAKLNRVDIDALAGRVNALIADLQSELKDGDVHQVLARLNDTLAEAQTQLRQVDLAGLSADLRAAARSANTLMQGPQTRELLTSAAAAADKFSVAAGKLSVLLAALQTTAQRASNGTSDVVAALGPILRDMQAIADNLRETTSDLRHYPAGVLLGGPPPREQPTR
jgi:ABC-type transporter Mla subunit MlaD